MEETGQSLKEGVEEGVGQDLRALRGTLID